MIFKYNLLGVSHRSHPLVLGLILIFQKDLAKSLCLAILALQTQGLSLSNFSWRKGNPIFRNLETNLSFLEKGRKVEEKGRRR